MNEITVYVSGGLVQDVINIPSDCLVKVVDYDIDNNLDCDKDEHGNPCCIAIYNSDK